jgi:hypothetical protein
MAPVAPEIMESLAPLMAVMTSRIILEYRPTSGATPAMFENAMDIGINENATTMPANISFLILPSQWVRRYGMMFVISEASFFV